MAVPKRTLVQVAAGENMTKKLKENGAESDKKAVATAQDIKYARFLAENEKKTRDRALKSLRKWLEHRGAAMPFKEEDFMVIWKGLFYSMWMSDKPLIQEECAESISNLIHCLQDPEQALLFYKCGLKIIGNEWFGIDQLRLDKFYMLVRRLLRQSLFLLKNNKWNHKLIKKFSGISEETILSTTVKVPLGLTMHFTEIYLEELAKVSEGQLHPMMMGDLLIPFVKQLVVTKEGRQRSCVLKNIFHYLMRQSDLGIDHTEKFEAWREIGFAGHINALEKVEVSSENEMSDQEESSDPIVLDPRAGRVDVTLPQLRFNAKQIVNLLTENKFMQGSTSKSRKSISKLIEDFSQMTKGDYPLGVKKIELPSEQEKIKLKKAAKALIKFDTKLMGGKKRKKVQIDPEIKEMKRVKRENYEKISNKIKNDLEAMMMRPRRKIIKKKNLPAPANTGFENELSQFEINFERNSGTWYVYTSGEEINLPSPKITKEKNSTPKVSIEKTNAASEWDEPLKEGETEIFVPSNKYKAKIAALTEKKELLNKELLNVATKIKGKNRHSLDSNLIRNPYARVSSSGGIKKVQINLRLNKSQDIDEHLATLKNSPASPWDSNKKPTKPLLKPNAVSSPINPFYKRKLNLNF